jgi:hypothetical protein
MPTDIGPSIVTLRTICWWAPQSSERMELWLHSARVSPT